MDPQCVNLSRTRWDGRPGDDMEDLIASRNQQSRQDFVRYDTSRVDTRWTPTNIFPQVNGLETISLTNVNALLMTRPQVRILSGAQTVTRGNAPWVNGRSGQIGLSSKIHLRFVPFQVAPRMSGSAGNAPCEGKPTVERLSARSTSPLLHPRPTYLSQRPGLSRRPYVARGGICVAASPESGRTAPTECWCLLSKARG